MLHWIKYLAGLKHITIIQINKENMLIILNKIYLHQTFYFYSFVI